MRLLLLSCAESCSWRMLGLISFLDPVRPDAKEAVENANKMGIEVSFIVVSVRAQLIRTCK